MQLIKTKSFELAIYINGNSHAEKFALILPGKLDTKDYAHMCSHADHLAKLGFLALSFDPPGTWESSGGINLYTTTNYIKAVHELIEYYDNRPTFVMGHSRGGSIAIIAGTENPHIFAYCAVMSSLNKDGLLKAPEPEWKKKGYQISKRDVPPGGGLKVKDFKLPYSFYEDQIQYELTDALIKCTKPKLFVTGKKDVIVDPESIKETFKLLSPPKKLYELDGGHDYRKYPELIEQVNKMIESFLINDIISP